DPRIDHLSGTDLDLARAYVDHEHARQRKLAEATGGGDVAEEAWRLLQVWDRLSLLVCMSPLVAGTEQTLPPVRSRDGDVRIEAKAAPDGTLVLDPYPFARDPEDFEVAAVVAERRTWSSEKEYRRDFR